MASPATGMRRRSSRKFPRLAPKDVTVSFTPHLVPMSRGELCTTYARLFGPRYVAGLFARPWPNGMAMSRSCTWRRAASFPATQFVRGSNNVLLGCYDDRIAGRAIVISALDNLVKGSAGQAIQNFNLLFGFAGNDGAGAGRAVPIDRPDTGMQFPHLFSPFRIKSTEFRNRIFSTGHDTYLPEGGLPSPALIAYQEARAKGGAGLIIIQVVGVHETARYTDALLMGTDDLLHPEIPRAHRRHSGAWRQARWCSCFIPDANCSAGRKA